MTSCLHSVITKLQSQLMYLSHDVKTFILFTEKAKRLISVSKGCIVFSVFQTKPRAFVIV